MGGGVWKSFKRRGEEISRRIPLPKRGFGPPFVWYVFRPLQGHGSFVLVQKRLRFFLLWYVFLPPFVLHPPISWPKYSVGVQWWVRHCTSEKLEQAVTVDFKKYPARKVGTR